jgi:hypothetical protein
VERRKVSVVVKRTLGKRIYGAFDCFQPSNITHPSLKSDRIIETIVIETIARRGKASI